MLGNQAVRNDKPRDLAPTKPQGKLNQGNNNSTTLAESKAREELNGSKSRYEKGMELYKQGKVSIVGDGLFKVSNFYNVDTGKMQCECPDYKTHKQPCKHIFACLLFTKNRGKDKISHLDGFNGNVQHDGQSTPMQKDAEGKRNNTDVITSKPTEVQKDFDKQRTITRLATINSAIEALKTHRKPIELDDILTLASRLEAWALGN